MKISSFRYIIAVVALVFALPLHAQVLQWQRFPIADSVYDMTISRLTKTRFGLFTGTRGNQVLFSYDNGNSWKKARWKGLGDTAYFPGNQIIAGTSRFIELPSKLFSIISLGYLCFSNDSGNTWEAIRGSLTNMPTNDYLLVDELLAKDNVLYALRYNNIFRSNDNGTTWNYLDISASIGYFPGLIISISLENNALIALTSSRQQFRSLNGGISWELLSNSTLPPTSNAGVTFITDKMFLAQERIERDSQVFNNYWISRDSGRTWQPFVLLGSNDAYSGFITVGSITFLATTQGIFTTRDKGSSWQKESGFGSLPDGRSASFLLDGKILYVTILGKGVYRADVSTITSVSGEYNQGFTIYPIAPNPSTDYTDLAFTLPRAAQAGVTLYSTLGTELWRSEIATMSAGEQHIRIDTRHLPTGVYAYRLMVDGVSSVGRVVVVR
jgi:photosystem II stability/assembly factor-like uncharacterized protein